MSKDILFSVSDESWWEKEKVISLTRILEETGRVVETRML